MKGQPYGSRQTVTALASGPRATAADRRRITQRTRDVFKTGKAGEASSLTAAHNWAFRVTQKRQPDQLQAAQNRRYGAGWRGRSSRSWHARPTGRPARLAAARM